MLVGELPIFLSVSCQQTIIYQLIQELAEDLVVRNNCRC